MAVVSSQSLPTNSSSKNFQVLGEPLSKSHIGLWLNTGSGNVWQDYDTWDLLGSVVLFHTAPATGDLLVNVYETSEEVPTSPDAYAILATLTDEIERLSESADSIDRVSESADNVDTVADGIDNVDITANNINNINITASAISGGGTTTGGQFTGGGLTKPLMYTSKVVTEDTTIPTGINALAIDELEIEDGVTLTLEDKVTMKVV